MMRKWLILIGLLAAALCLAGCTRSAPVIAPAETFLDLGDVVNGVVVQREVVIENIGDRTLVIEAVSTSCGCTSATIEPMTIQPGESGLLLLAFDSGAHGSQENGELLRQIFVASNDPDQPEVVIEMRANVIPQP